MPHHVLLGVNIDHVATLRQARGTDYPDPLLAALMAEQAGADGITVHLREDRRHIQATDVEKIKSSIQTRLNLEMAATESMLEFALSVKPEYVCIVPEKREEVTTEGGLDVIKYQAKLTDMINTLDQAGIQISLFIDAEKQQIEAAKQVGAKIIEIHTGFYANSASSSEQQHHLALLTEHVDFAHQLGFIVNAGHGLTARNVQPIARIPYMNELNIGHSIISDAVFTGLTSAVAKMKHLIQLA